MSVDVLRFKQLDPRAVLPKRGSVLAAGLDVCAIEEMRIGAKQRGMARTGLAVKNGLDVLAGVIDADYRGEICVVLYNTGDETIELPAGSKICQLIVEQIITPAAEWATDLDETARGAGGFGSTG